MPRKSLNELLEFISYSAEQGWLKAPTAAARKAAINRVFAVLSSAEAADVQNLDVDEILERFRKNEGSKIAETTLLAYEGRVTSSWEEFHRWLESPENFRSGVVTRERSLAANQDGPFGQIKSSQVDIPLRRNLTISVQGLPFDLKKSEAEKIANVVLAMVLNDQSKEKK